MKCGDKIIETMSPTFPRSLTGQALNEHHLVYYTIKRKIYIMDNTEVLDIWGNKKVY